MSQRLFWLIPACLIAFGGCAKKKEEAEKEGPAPVQVTAVTTDTVQRVTRGDGALFPKDQWNVMPKITAPVAKFLVNRGDHVRAGQLLAVLENRDLVATAAANKGAVTQAQANMATTQRVTIPEAIVKARTDVKSAQEAADAARKVLESRQQLLKEGALARKLVDDASVAYVQAAGQIATAQEHLRTLEAAGTQAQIEAARGQLESAEGQYRTAEATLAYSEVRSPGAGIVADRPLYPGDMAATGTPLVVIVDISRVVARVNVPVNEAAAVKVGQPATVKLEEGGQEYAGKVTVVSPATDPQAATIQVWIELPNPGEHLKPGATAHASIVTETIRNATLVPTSAILPGEEGGQAVLVITPDSVAHKRNVQLGVRQGDKVQVLNGVLPGEEVVTVGGMGVDDKGKVKIIEANAPPPEEEENGPEEEKPSPAAPKKEEGKPKQK
jgi:multidrug efflux pump subunit AcrA (membrane-fusion protein)